MPRAPIRPNPSGSRSWRRIAARPEAQLLLMLGGVAGALWLFVGLAGEVREGDTTAFDERLLLALRRHGDLADPIGPRWLQESARDITALGGFTVLTLLSVLAIVLLLMHGRRAQALVFGATVVIAQAAAEGIKHVIGRARPDLVPHHDLVYSASFPSGHSMMTPVVYLTLAAIIAAGEARTGVKVLLIVCAGLLMICVGASRVYLGVHWPTDVLAGWTLGAAFAACAAFLLHRTAPRKGAADQVKPDSPGVS